jgi:uncharacterized protein YcbK (DUF882 family)
MLQERALDNLEAIRIAFGSPLICNSRVNRNRGYRSFAENERVGGAKYSRHPQGIAFDLTPKDVPLAHLMAFLETAADAYELGGIGFYIRRNFIHIDWRSRRFPEPTFWIED